ncbi:hypothetical protein ASE59_17250 [Sphingomonas sp. Leaf10]|nr:hypothetical protein ASE59_17250 [Sphingomonas sp. Leaf10]
MQRRHAARIGKEQDDVACLRRRIDSRCALGTSADRCGKHSKEKGERPKKLHGPILVETDRPWRHAMKLLRQRRRMLGRPMMSMRMVGETGRGSK